MQRLQRRNNVLARVALAAALLVAGLAIGAPASAQQRYPILLGPRSLYPETSRLRSRSNIPIVIRDALEYIANGTRLLALGPRVMGGELAAAGAFPWMASLELKTRRRDSHFCGGAFIAPQWVITAAHCVTTESGGAVDVLGGTNTLDAGGALYSVDRVIVHEKYSTETQDYDVALLHLDRPFSGTTVRLLTAADAGRLAAPGDLAVSAGWGYTAEDGDVSNILRQVTVQIVSNKTCNGLAAYAGAVTDRMVCAGFPEGGKDSCQGDSGGPLVVSDGNGGYFQAGVTSWGEGCGRPNKFGVYTRVSTIADWVAEKIGTKVAPVASNAVSKSATAAPVQPERLSNPPSMPLSPPPTAMVMMPKPRPPALGPRPVQRSARFEAPNTEPADRDTGLQQLGPRGLYPNREREIGPDQPLVMRDALQYLEHGTRLLAINPRIIGGEPAPPGSFPWAASLELKGRARQGNHFCGGSFIAPEWVMTAAHCVKSGSAPSIEVLGGSHELDRGGTLYPVDRVIVNEKYDDGTQDYDVALLHLTRRFEGRTLPLITPAQAQRLTGPGSPAVTIGWGLTSENGGVSNILREVNLQIVSQAACNAPAAYNGSLGNTMICAGFAQGGKDACQGDSGGPMMVMDSAGNYVQAGIVSWGEGCGKPEKFGVYTRVSEIQAWVAEKIGSRARSSARARTSSVPAAPRSRTQRTLGAPTDRKYTPAAPARAQARRRSSAPEIRAAPRTLPRGYRVYETPDHRRYYVPPSFDWRVLR